jgi:hypothetical protein
MENSCEQGNEPPVSITRHEISSLSEGLTVSRGVLLRRIG